MSEYFKRLSRNLRVLADEYAERAGKLLATDASMSGLLVGAAGSLDAAADALDKAVDVPTCHEGNPATCIGVSEGTSVSYGCDKCCSHCDTGDERCKPHLHEDGYCYALADIPEWISELLGRTT